MTPRPVSAVRLDGGRLCVDFVNTIHDRYAVDIEDYVEDPQRFLAWSERAGALFVEDEVRVPHASSRRAALMREVRLLRDHLHALLASRVDDLTPPGEAVRGLDRWLHLAWQGQSFGTDGQLHWRNDARDAQLPLKRIALDALDLLASPVAARLCRCANTTSCGWLFLDVSKNQRRRWCAMQTCGTAEKMQRYRRS